MNTFGFGQTFYDNYIINNCLNVTSDITSIINYLEGSKSNNIYSFNGFHLLNVKEQFNLIMLWLSTTLCSYMQKCNLNDLTDIQENLNKLYLNIDKMKKQARTRRKKTDFDKKYTLTCPTCNKSAPLSEDVKFWDLLSIHNHFEEKLVSLIKPQNNAGNDLKSCVLQIEEPVINYQPVIRNYAPDVNYNFRFNFSTPQYYLHPMYVPVVVQPVMPPRVFGVNTVVTRPVNPIVKFQPPPQEQQKQNDYCMFVKNTLYPKEIMMQHDTYVLQLRDGLCFCLICLVHIDSIKCNLIEHLNGRKHMKALENTMIMDSLRQYHFFWKQQTTDDQMEQQNFNSISKKCMQCVACNRSLAVDAINTHLSSSEHKINCNKHNGKTIPTKPHVSNNENFDSDATSTNSDNSSMGESDIKVTNDVQHKLKKSITENIAFFDQLEFRFRSHLTFLTEKPKTINCKLCLREIPKSIDSVKEHLIGSYHNNQSRIPNLSRKYFCSICNIYKLNEKNWMNHYKASSHKNNFDQLDEAKKKKTIEYECSCGTIAFGEKDVVINHMKSSQRIKETYRLKNSIKETIKSNENLEKEIKSLLNESNELLKLKDNMMKCCKGIEEAVKDVFPNCKAYPFGSRVTGLGSRESDLDVFLDIGDMYNGNQLQDATAQKKILRNVRNIFYKKRSTFVDINPIPTARTPIIQVVHIPTNIDFDVSFKNGLSVENTEFIRLCINLEESTRPLILFLKKLLKIQNLNTNISTYALSMMVIFYLQTNNHLLPVQNLKILNNKSKIIQDWEAIDYRITLEEIKPHIVPSNKTLKESLINLFNFYANFNFATDVICPLLGRIIKKNDFIMPLDGSSLPEEMQTYVRKLENPSSEIFKSCAELCVQDPFDLSHNLTKACRQGIVTRFKSLCEMMAKELSKTE